MNYYRNFGKYTGTVWTGLNREIDKRFRQAGLSLTPEQFRIMIHLWTHERCSQQELARLAWRDKAAITRILDLLVAKGLVQRTVDGEDRRSNTVSLTESGKLLEAPTARCVQEALDLALKGIPSERVEIAMEVLEAAQKNLAGPD